MSRMAASLPQTAIETPKRQPEVRVRKAHNGGYIVSKESESYGPSKDMVYQKLSGVLKCMKEAFADEESDCESTNGKEKAEGE